MRHQVLESWRNNNTTGWSDNQREDIAAEENAIDINFAILEAASRQRKS